MTTITMEKHILKRLDALEDFAKEIRAALAAPATTPEQPRPFIPWSKEAEMLESWAAQPERKPPQGQAMTTREAFEAHIRKKFPTVKEELLFSRSSIGRYRSIATEDAWQAWQAATAAALERAAEEVERTDKENWFAGQCAFSKHAAQAIRALKKKP